MHAACPKCDYRYRREPGFYLGAMMVPFFFSGATTIPFAITLKLAGSDGMPLVRAIGLFYGVVVSILLFYARTAWLHIEFRFSKRLARHDNDR